MLYHEAAQLLLHGDTISKHSLSRTSQWPARFIDPSGRADAVSCGGKCYLGQFSVNQINHRSFELENRPKLVPLVAHWGWRALFRYLLRWGETGGVACSMEKFWEKAPSAIEVTGITQKETQITMWQWSPNAANGFSALFQTGSYA